MRQSQGRYAVGGSNRQPGRIGTVGEHSDDLGGVIDSFGGLDQGTHIGAAARDQNGDALPRRHSESLPSKVTGASVRAVRWPMMAAVSPSALRCATSFSASSGPTAASIPTPQLKVPQHFPLYIHAANPGQPGKNLWHGDGVEADRLVLPQPLGPIIATNSPFSIYESELSAQPSSHHPDQTTVSWLRSDNRGVAAQA